MIKLAISGCCGRMGSRIAELASRNKDYFIITSLLEKRGHPNIGTLLWDLSITDDPLQIKKADCLIEFTSPEVTLEHLEIALQYKKPAVIGTTGLTNEQKNKLTQLSKKIPIIFSPNMSIGVNLLFKLVKDASKALKEYRINIIEAHHIHKKDAPSGTAKKISEIIKEGAGKEVDDIKSIREDEIIGDHEVIFDSPLDTIKLVHSAKTRDIFASGALEAAKWIVKKSAVYSIYNIYYMRVLNTMDINSSDRIKSLPPYLFVEIDKTKRKLREEGRDLIDLGIGDPDQPTPTFIIEKLYEASRDPANHRYALDNGMQLHREAIGQWYKRRFNVLVDPNTEILPLIGSKEGIAHFPLAILNKGDYALVPDPSYPPYRGGTIFAGGKVYSMPLLAKNDFLPDIKKNKISCFKKAKIIYVNYPNNPTSAVATDDFYKELIQFALQHNIIIVSDLAYSEITFDGYKPRSLLEFDDSRNCVIEFHSLSKTYNMTGWRCGWACGNSQLVQLLGKVKTNIDSGIFQAIQIAAISALQSDDIHIKNMCALYQERRDTLIVGLKSIGLKTKIPKATFYIWIKVPKDHTSSSFTNLLLEKTDIVVAPGVGFGTHGEGYIRMALTISKERIREAVERLKKVV